MIDDGREDNRSYPFGFTLLLLSASLTWFEVSNINSIASCLPSDISLAAIFLAPFALILLMLGAFFAIGKMGVEGKGALFLASLLVLSVFLAMSALALSLFSWYSATIPPGASENGTLVPDLLSYIKVCVLPIMSLPLLFNLYLLLLGIRSFLFFERHGSMAGTALVVFGMPLLYVLFAIIGAVIGAVCWFFVQFL